MRDSSGSLKQILNFVIFGKAYLYEHATQLGSVHQKIALWISMIIASWEKNGRKLKSLWAKLINDNEIDKWDLDIFCEQFLISLSKLVDSSYASHVDIRRFQCL
jgi:hypothetical protein